MSITDTEHPEHETTQIPEYFDQMDVRMPPQKYVEQKLREVVEEPFEVRRRLEKNMSRRELLAFDKVLRKYLEPEQVLKRLEAAIEDDSSLLDHGRQTLEQSQNAASAHSDQHAKEVDMQREYNKSIKNEDSLYKQLAFGTMMEMKYKDMLENPMGKQRRDLKAMFDDTTFDRWYINQLELEA